MESTHNLPTGHNTQVGYWSSAHYNEILRSLLSRFMYILNGCTTQAKSRTLPALRPSALNRRPSVEFWFTWRYRRDWLPIIFAPSLQRPSRRFVQSIHSGAFLHSYHLPSVHVTRFGVTSTRGRPALYRPPVVIIHREEVRQPPQDDSILPSAPTRRRREPQLRVCPLYWNNLHCSRILKPSQGLI